MVALPPPIVRTGVVPPPAAEFHVPYERHIAAVLAQEIATLFDLSIVDVWGVMQMIPNEELTLLWSPPGWTIIADRVATDLINGQHQNVLVPTIH